MSCHLSATDAFIPLSLSLSSIFEPSGSSSSSSNNITMFETTYSSTRHHQWQYALAVYHQIQYYRSSNNFVGGVCDILRFITE
mmetsp:Transcript_37153/g.41408  ORF Transcript_37153/g.41408 Transcript_37153/m.41408 type:complete len:83 (-) Transcript_37153:14-262(-)